jgi:hypothetical protein
MSHRTKRPARRRAKIRRKRRQQDRKRVLGWLANLGPSEIQVIIEKGEIYISPDARRLIEKELLAGQ